MTYPVEKLIVLLGARLEPQLEVRIVSLHQILQNAAGLPHVDLLAGREGIGDGRDSSVRVDGQVPGLLLSASYKVVLVHPIGHSEFFKGDGDLDPVGRLRGVQRDGRFVRLIWCAGHSFALALPVLCRKECNMEIVPFFCSPRTSLSILHSVYEGVEPE
jgi:hypothetical protein